MPALLVRRMSVSTTPSLVGHATHSGTRRILSRSYPLIPLHSSTKNQSAPWAVSRVGFGTYGVSDLEQHGLALASALRQGMNLIDTSPGFGNGQSERIIGQVLRTLVSEESLTRDSVVLISKVGRVCSLEEIASLNISDSI